MTRQNERIRVIFVHGLFSKPSAWKDFERLVASDPELNDFVTTSCFRYDTPRLRLRPDRRIADVDDIADQLGTYLVNRMRDDESIVLVTHSQGGLVAQRFLVRTLQRHEGLSLRRIRQVVMYACPNRGAQFFLLARRLAWFARNPQERELRPFTKVLTETERAIIRSVLNATDNTETECHVPIAAYGGASDNIVPTHVAYSIFPVFGVVPGDHFSIIRPTNHDDESYRVLKNALVALGTERTRAHDVHGSVDDRHKAVDITPPYNERTTSLHGRRELVSSIMSENSRRRVQVIAGFGGLGKSRLALEIAHRERNRRRVWWIQSSRINSGMREVALQLGAPTSGVDRAWVEVESAADLVWRRLNDSMNPWLLVIDNADDPTMLSAPEHEVSDGSGWLREPTNPTGMVIVTSRDRGEHTWGNWCQLHRIRPLEAEDGAYLLMDRAGPGAGTNEQARALSDQLGGLPLALSKAGDYLSKVVNTRVFAGDEVITDFETFRLAAERRFRAPAGGPHADQDEFRWLHAVRSVVDIAFDLLTRRGLYEAAPLLKLFACLGVAPIPYRVLLSSRALEESSLFSEFTGARQHSVLEALDDFGLIETVRSPHIHGALEHALTLHPLVQNILREDPDVQNRLDEYYGLNVRIMLDVTEGADPDEPANWILWNAIAVHAIGVCRTALLGDIRLHDASVVASCLELARLATRYLIAIGLLVPASDLVTSLIANCGAFGFADSDRPLLGLRHELGRIAIERGNPAEAEKELAKVIELRTEILGFDHPDTLASRHKHARAILEQDRWAEAEELLRAIVEAERTVRGSEFKDTLFVRHSLARAVLNLGRPAEAEEMLRGILEVYDRPDAVMSPISSEASRARSSLARALMEQKRYAEAEENMRDALSLTPNGQTTAGVFWMRWALAEALLFQVKIRECTVELERLHVDQKEVLGLTHPDTVRTEKLLAKIKSIPNGG